MRVVVPFAAERPKTRLEQVLSRAERAAFATAMLRDVLAAVNEAGVEPLVLSTAPVEVAGEVVVDDRSLTTAVNAVLSGEHGPGVAETPIAIVMADLALATSRVLEALFEEPGDVVIAPGRGGGTNALVVREPSFRVDYHGASYLDHLAGARHIGASVAAFDSHRLATDVDEPADLAEVLIHTDGRAHDWLVDAGFSLSVSDGGVSVVRK
jgi:2-phospho-L-lactate guanylyltransferase